MPGAITSIHTELGLITLAHALLGFRCVQNTTVATSTLSALRFIINPRSHNMLQYYPELQKKRIQFCMEAFSNSIGKSLMSQMHCICRSDTTCHCQFGLHLQHEDASKESVNYKDNSMCKQCFTYNNVHKRVYGPLCQTLFK